MGADRPSTAEEFFEGSALGLEVFGRVVAMTDALGGAQVTVSRSQIAFRRRRGFAYLWRPGQYLRRTTAEVVLAIALGREDASPRWKQVAHPAPHVWMHHLEIRAVDDLDDEVAARLAEAIDLASHRRERL